MKIILSKKGFDSSYGGVASPVFVEDKSFISLPIPTDNPDYAKDKGYSICYNNLSLYGHNYGKLVEDLTKNKIKGDDITHFDPDIIREVYQNRKPEWTPLFGQDSSFQGHLRLQNVGKGDIFLFFGLFRMVKKVGNNYQYVRGAKKFNMLWGWMQIEDIISVDNSDNKVKDWMKYHSHFYLKDSKQNTLYLASKDLIIDEEVILENGGAGKFKKYSEELQLTRQGSDPWTDWILPSCFYNSEMTFHQKDDRWKLIDDKVELKAVSRGQEFVLDCKDNSQVVDWIKNIIKKNTMP
ncbi:MAG: hypothetical protein PHY08_13280 [Candidatus Cloacimonetes bacterium]|nr:hypothetical protein [Candidatus Cloacimonadota bacterium]